MPEVDHLTPEERDALVAIRHRKVKLVTEHRRKKSIANVQAVLPRRGERERTSNVTKMKVCLATPLIYCLLPGRNVCPPSPKGKC